MRLATIVGAFAATLLLVAQSAIAAPIWDMRVNGSGIPLILAGNGAGWSGDGSKYLTVTADGFVQGYDPLASGREYHTLDPSLESLNNAATDAEVALTQIWLTSQDLYVASVSTTQKTNDGGNNGMTRALPTTGAYFTWLGGGTATAREFRFEDSGGSPDGDSGSLALRASMTTTGGSSGFHKTGLALIGEEGTATDVWNVVGGLAGSGGGAISSGVRKQQWGALTGLDTSPDPNAVAGTRAITGYGALTNGVSAQDLINSLVPGISDGVYEMAVNPGDGYLYFISQDTANDKVYLSAVSVPGDAFTGANLATETVVTIVDLNPGETNTYLELTYIAADNANDLTGQNLDQSFGLAFSNDGSTLYVSNYDGGNPANGNYVFQFDFAAAVPEPSTVVLLVLGGLLMGAVHVRRRR